jgi:hypothetical protein
LSALLQGALGRPAEAPIEPDNSPASAQRWRLTSASIVWTDRVETPRTAALIFEAILGTPPQLSREGKVPTFTMPCRGLARGNAGGIDLEVALQSSQFSAQITLNADENGSLDLERLERAISVAEGLRSACAWQSLAMACRTLPMTAEAARGAFSQTVGIAPAAPHVASQTYKSIANVPLISPSGDQLHVDLELGLYSLPPHDGSWLEANVVTTWDGLARDASHPPLRALLSQALLDLQGMRAAPWGMDQSA